MKFYVALEKAEEGGFNVSVPALDGCFLKETQKKKLWQMLRKRLFVMLEALEKLNPIKSKAGVTLKEVGISL